MKYVLTGLTCAFLLIVAVYAEKFVDVKLALAACACIWLYFVGAFWASLPSRQACEQLERMGLIGTVGGIIYGLWGFDVGAVESGESAKLAVAHLLGGLSVAFSTTLLGFVLAFIYKEYGNARTR